MISKKVDELLDDHSICPIVVESCQPMSISAERCIELPGRRWRLHNEPVAAFAHNVPCLASYLAYPKFDEEANLIVSRNAF